MSSEKKKQLSSALNREVRIFIAGSSLFSQRVAEKLGMHPTDLQFLNLLEMTGPVTPGTLAHATGLSSGGVTVVLDRLERAGYIRRDSNPADRRSVLVVLQPGKHRRLTANYDAVQKQFEGVLERFPERDLEIVLQFFSAANEMRPSGTESRTAKNASS